MELTNSNSNVGLYSKQSLSYSKEMSSSAEFSLSSGEYDTKSGRQQASQSAVAFDFSYSEALMMESTRVAYANESDMSDQDRLKKQLIEQIFDRFNNFGNSDNEGSEIGSFPFFPMAMPDGEQKAPMNPYMGVPAGNYGGHLIQVSEQYYQKQTIDFSASLQIQTPNETFEMEISISFTQEIYQERTTTYAISEEMFKDPFVVNFDEDRNPFEGLLLHFEFDKAKEEDEKSEIEKLLEELLVWQKGDESTDSNEKLLAVIDPNKQANYFGDVQEGFSYQRSESYYSERSFSFSASLESGTADTESIDVAV